MSNFNSIYSKLPLLFYYYLLEVEVFKTPPNFSTASTAALEAPVTKIFNFDELYYCANKNNILENIRNSERYKLIIGNICSSDLINHILNEYKINK